MQLPHEQNNKRGFGSDNHSGVHPQLLDAIQYASQGHAPSYGTDTWSERADQAFKKHFGTQAKIFYVFNGTAANALSTCALLRSYESILATDISHLNTDECGAPEFFSGAKIIGIPHKNGKLRVEDLEMALVRRGDQHHSQIRAISLTQPTELGTVYSLEELQTLISWAKKNGLFIHMDGARIANAVRYLQTDFHNMTTALGVDIVSFGGTKNGFLFGEAVVFLNPKLAENFKYIRKQGAQLPSKTRFIAAQFETYLTTSLWQDIADQQLALAHELESELRKIPELQQIHEFQITQKPQSNAVFVQIPKNWLKPLREHSFFYVWNEHNFECRWMISWDTKKEDIKQFLIVIQQLAIETLQKRNL